MTQSQLINKILQASNIIHNQSLKKSANWLLSSKEISDVLEKLSISHERNEKIDAILNSDIYQSDGLKITYNKSLNEVRIFNYDLLKCIIYNIQDDDISYLMKLIKDRL